MPTMVPSIGAATVPTKASTMTKIPNELGRQFNVDAANRVWCDDVTYISGQVTAGRI